MQQKKTKAPAKSARTNTLTPPAPVAKARPLPAPEPAHVPDVVPAGSSAAARAQTEAILGMVRQDIANAEVGRFFALRAGVGLIVVKEMCDHGEWSQEMLRLIPDRSPRTLRLYMANAREFLDNKALMARDVWPKLASVGTSALGAAAARLLIGDGSESVQEDADIQVPDEVRAMAEYLREDAAQAEQARASSAAPRPLTAAEKRKAAADLWTQLAGRVTDEGIARQTWQVLDQETLETCASALRTVADKMMSAARKAKAAKI